MALGAPRLWLTLAVIAHLVSAGQQAAPTPVGSLSGIVTDSASVAIPGVRIVVLQGSDQRITATNAAGRYQFDGLPVGTYSIGASLTAFLTQRGQVQIAANQVTTWNATLIVRSGYTKEPPSGLDQTDAVLSAGIYEAVLRHVYRGNVPERPIVRLVSLIQPLDELEWPARLASAPLSLQRSSSTPEARRPVRLRPASFPAGTRLIESPGPGDLLHTSFSRVFVTDDRLGALVVFAHTCGALCGESALVWLRRDGASTPWTIRATYTFYIS